PLNTSSGVAGAAAVVRYLSPPSPVQPPPFGLVELQYFTAVAAHIAGALELTQAVAATRAAATRAAAMVDASPLPLALVDPRGHVLQINQAGRDVFGLAPEASVVGQPIDTLGLSSSEVAFADVLLRSRTMPWHGRVAIVQPVGGGQRLCDCTVTVLSGLGSDDILVALYDRT